MSDIEQLLRESLHSAPTPTPKLSDPVTTIERRTRRARALVAGAAAVIAIGVAAGIIVPLSALGHSRASGVVVSPAQSPTPRPSPTSAADEQLIWMGANWVATAPTGLPWMVYVDNSGPNGGTRLAQLVTNKMPRYRVRVQTPADMPVPGRNIVWVVGFVDGSGAHSRVSAVTTSGRLVATQAYPGKLLTYSTVVGDDLYMIDGGNAAGARIDRLRLVNGRITMTSVAAPMAETVWSTKNGEVWAQTTSKLVEITDSGSGIALGTSVSWRGDIVGTVTDESAPDALWAWDGSRLVQLSPALLTQGVSVAEGARLALPGRAGAAVSSPDGGVFVSIPDGARTGVYYYPRDQFGAGQPRPSATLDGVQAVMICADPRGGVDVLDNDAIVQEWNPRP